MVKLKNNYQKILVSYFVLLFIFWAVLLATHSKSGNYNYLYSFMFGLVPFVGGLVGIIRSRLWGSLKSATGRAVFYLSLGLLLWGFGGAVWSYYNFVLKVAAPYPSVADIGFAPSIFFWCLGAINLSKASGAIFNLKRSHKAQLFVAVITPLLLGLSYYILVTVARQGAIVPAGESALKTVLDIAYPLGDLLAVLLSTIIFGLSFKYFGGYYKSSIVAILVGLSIMYVADSVFSYTTTVGTFYNADWGDMLLTIGLTFMTFGVLGFASHPRIAKKEQSRGA